MAALARGTIFAATMIVCDDVAGLCLLVGARAPGFGLFASRNAIAIVVLFMGAVSLSAAIFLIEELNNPLEGFITSLRAPMDTS